MHKTYSKKENISIWYFLLILVIALIIFGYVLIHYFVWQALPLLVMIISKINKLSNNNTSPIIELDDNGLTIVNPVLGNHFYSYIDIKKIHLNSKVLNGYLILKSSNKKIRIDSVAIDLIDQQDIATFVNTKIAI